MNATLLPHNHLTFEAIAHPPHGHLPETWQGLPSDNLAPLEHAPVMAPLMSLLSNRLRPVIRKG